MNYEKKIRKGMRYTCYNIYTSYIVILFILSLFVMTSYTIIVSPADGINDSFIDPIVKTIVNI